MKRIITLLTAGLLLAASLSHAEDFVDTSRVYGWSGTYQFSQYWPEFKAQLAEELTFVGIEGLSFNLSTLDDLTITGGSVTAGSFDVGSKYSITTVGTTDFTLIGAADSSVGTVFKATGAGTGTGVANELLPTVSASPTIKTKQTYTASVIDGLSGGGSSAIEVATDPIAADLANGESVISEASGNMFVKKTNRFYTYTGSGVELYTGTFTISDDLGDAALTIGGDAYGIADSPFTIEGNGVTPITADYGSNDTLVWSVTTPTGTYPDFSHNFSANFSAVATFTKGLATSFLAGAVETFEAGEGLFTTPEPTILKNVDGAIVSTYSTNAGTAIGAHHLEIYDTSAGNHRKDVVQIDLGAEADNDWTVRWKTRVEEGPDGYTNVPFMTVVESDSDPITSLVTKLSVNGSDGDGGLGPFRFATTSSGSTGYVGVGTIAGEIICIEMEIHPYTGLADNSTLTAFQEDCTTLIDTFDFEIFDLTGLYLYFGGVSDDVDVNHMGISDIEFKADGGAF